MARSLARYGPLRGLTVLELAGLAPGPFAGMILSDFGARVIRVERPGQDVALDTLARGKESIALDLRAPAGRDALAALCERADVLLDPYRPGTLEGLGLAPATLMEANSRLVIARLTGYGQDGPLAARAGHDLNYLATAGVLSAFARSPGAPPTPPVNLLADFAGGGMACALGVVLALFDRERSGRGQVVDASMTEGASYLATFLHKFAALGMWGAPPGGNLLDGGAPFYDVYRCADGRWLAVGPIEPQFFASLVTGIRAELARPGDAAAAAAADAGSARAGDGDGGEGDDWPSQFDRDAFPALRERLRAAFARRDMDRWAHVFRDSDACVSPVLSLPEAAAAPHAVARGAFAEDGDGHVVPQPAPRLSRTPAASTAGRRAPRAGEHTAAVLAEFGLADPGGGRDEGEKATRSDGGSRALSAADLKARL